MRKRKLKSYGNREKGLDIDFIVVYNGPCRPRWNAVLPAQCVEKAVFVFWEAIKYGI